MMSDVTYTTWTAAPIEFSALEDQQLGGLVMWIPGGFAYMIAGLVIIEEWLAPTRNPSAPLKHRFRPLAKPADVTEEETVT